MVVIIGIVVDLCMIGDGDSQCASTVNVAFYRITYGVNPGLEESSKSAWGDRRQYVSELTFISS